MNERRRGLARSGDGLRTGRGVGGGNWGEAEGALETMEGLGVDPALLSALHFPGCVGHGDALLGAWLVDAAAWEVGSRWPPG